MTAALGVAIAACAVAVAALVATFLLWRRLAGIAREQKVVLANSDHRDLLEFAVALQGRIDDVHRVVDEVATGLSRVDRRVDGAVTNTAVVRYDAYEGTGGQQSASVALLDANRTGAVVTAIQGRDYARIYVKDLDRGRSSVALSPEEQEAVERAMSARAGGTQWFPPEPPPFAPVSEAAPSHASRRVKAGSSGSATLVGSSASPAGNRSARYAAAACFEAREGTCARRPGCARRSGG